MANAFDPAAPGDGNAFGSGILEVQIPGPQGDPGPPIVLQIGTVGSGLVPSATIEQVTSLLYRLNLILQQGAQGNQGPVGATTILQIGTVSTLNPGSAATVEMTGAGQTKTLNFGIPRGNNGVPGTDSGSTVGVFRMAAGAITATNYKPALDSEIFNNSPIVLVPANPTRLVIPAGVSRVRIKAQLEFNFTTPPDQPVMVELIKNGASVSPKVYKKFPPGETYTMEIESYSQGVVASDYFELIVTCAATSFSGAITANSWLQVDPR